jgi:hypothetical protein
MFSLTFSLSASFLKQQRQHFVALFIGKLIPPHAAFLNAAPVGRFLAV